MSAQPKRSRTADLDPTDHDAQAKPSARLKVAGASVLGAQALDRGDPVLLNEMAKRIDDIEQGYRAMAEKVGQLYMRVNEAGLEQVAEMLDQPMRNASDIEQSFAALLHEFRQNTRHVG